MKKRFFDLFFATAGLILLSPMMLLIAIFIKWDSSGPVFFRQDRVGLHGRIFRIFKFRSMFADAEKSGLNITVGSDRRITYIGKFLRTYKLDELPQLINVIIGNMSLVGPRPEIPRYVKLYPEEIKKVIFSVKPGITDYASIKFKDENIILNQYSNPEKAYIEEIMPIKLNYYKQYIKEHSVWIDFKLIILTFLAILQKR